MKYPIYFGGMILSDFETTYQYENWLKWLLEFRFKKYAKRWGFFAGMLAIFRQRKKEGKYTQADFHPVPVDPLICFSSDIEFASDMLSLKRKKLKIIEFEVYKYFRRKRCYPT